MVIYFIHTYTVFMCMGVYINTHTHTHQKMYKEKREFSPTQVPEVTTVDNLMFLLEIQLFFFFFFKTDSIRVYSLFHSLLHLRVFPGCLFLPVFTEDHLPLQIYFILVVLITDNVILSSPSIR